MAASLSEILTEDAKGVWNWISNRGQAVVDALTPANKAVSDGAKKTVSNVAGALTDVLSPLLLPAALILAGVLIFYYLKRRVTR